MHGNVGATRQRDQSTCFGAILSFVTSIRKGRVALEYDDTARVRGDAIISGLPFSRATLVGQRG